MARTRLTERIIDAAQPGQRDYGLARVLLGMIGMLIAGGARATHMAFLW